MLSTDTFSIRASPSQHLPSKIKHPLRYGINLGIESLRNNFQAL